MYVKEQRRNRERKGASDWLLLLKCWFLGTWEGSTQPTLSCHAVTENPPAAATPKCREDYYWAASFFISGAFKFETSRTSSVLPCPCCCPALPVKHADLRNFYFQPLPATHGRPSPYPRLLNGCTHPAPVHSPVQAQASPGSTLCCCEGPSHARPNHRQGSPGFQSSFHSSAFQHKDHSTGAKDPYPCLPAPHAQRPAYRPYSGLVAYDTVEATALTAGAGA
jgi:hypothetical protein